MIDRIVVKNFKTFVSATVELGLVNVFIGANGSGKSNLLEAVALLGTVAHGQIDAEFLRYRGVRSGVCRSFISQLGHLTSGSMELSASRGTIEYQVELGCGVDSDGWAIRQELVLQHEGELYHRTKVSGSLLPRGVVNSQALPVAMSETRSYAFSALANIFGGVVDAAPKDFLDWLASYSIFTPATINLRGIHDDSARIPLGLNGEGLARAIVQMLDKGSESLGPYPLDEVYDLIEWADDISTQSPESALQIGREPNRTFELRDRFMKNGFRSLSPSAVSEGALYVLFLLALVGHPKSPRFFGIDNFDQALHPRLARELTRMIADQIVADGNRQMLATTHNPLVLDGLNLLDDRIRLFAVDRDDEGASQIRRIEVTEELMAEAKNGMSLSRLWMMGRLGGMPKSL